MPGEARSASCSGASASSSGGRPAAGVGSRPQSVEPAGSLPSLVTSGSYAQDTLESYSQQASASGESSPWAPGSPLSSSSGGGASVPSQAPPHPLAFKLEAQRAADATEELHALLSPAARMQELRRTATECSDSVLHR